MNIAMEQTEEYIDGELQAKYGDCFIRGNNGTSLEIVSSIHVRNASNLFSSPSALYLDAKETMKGYNRLQK